jgi:hypothetical protein
MNRWVLFRTCDVLVCAANKRLHASDFAAKASHSNAASNAKSQQSALPLHVMQTEIVGFELRAQPFRQRCTDTPNPHATLSLE